MKLTKYVPYFIIALLVMAACKKDASHSSINNVDAYFCGYVNKPMGGMETLYWKNNEPVKLTDSFYNCQAFAIAVNGPDVYVAGDEDDVVYRPSYLGDSTLQTEAIYWKNGIPIKLSSLTSHAKAIVVNGNDVYVAGSINGNAVYWKNGMVINLPDSSSTSTAYGITVVGSDIYVVGTSNETYPSPAVATYWKNGVVTYLKGNYYFTYASAITVSGNDVYITGITSISGYHPIATYWKNGVPVPLTDNTVLSYATAIAVSGPDVYVAGSISYLSGYNGTNASLYTAAYWKNGVVNKLVSSFGAFAIAVTGKDIYVGGYSDSSRSIYWKNKIPIKLHPNYGPVTGVALVSH